MPSFLTSSLHGHAVKFSQCFSNQFAVATCDNFGFAGGGVLFILEISEQGVLQELRRTRWTNSLFDVAWNDTNLVVSASGDGSLQVWDTLQLQSPVLLLQEHTLEVSSVDWNQSSILSTSWDKTIKVWSPVTHNSLVSFLAMSPVHGASWSPMLSPVFSSVAADGMLHIWDTSLPHRPVLSRRIHTGDSLSCAWSQHDANIVFTTASDCTVKCLDLRNLNTFLHELTGSEYPIRKVVCSPHDRTKLAAVSYDLRTRVWEWSFSPAPVEVIHHHSEFVYGLDFNQHKAGQLADCGWDSLVHVYSPKSLQQN